MKRKAITVVLLLVTAQAVFAGGILTNTNQSVQFARMLSRNASLGIDAVYFNPAGITMLGEGFHLAFHSQTITQGRTITNTSPWLNQDSYSGDTFVPVFPNLYAVLKKDKMAFAVGFGPIAGGGTADFQKGIPDFETQLSLIPLLVSSQGIPTTAYSADIAFKGSSIYYGIQFSAAYAFTEIVSASIGARYNIASNMYEGSLGNIKINPAHPLLNPSNAMISASGFFTAIGDPVTAAALSDQEVDATQSGTGITPILGLNIRPSHKLNIGLKYEHVTKLVLENETEKDLLADPQFPDGMKMRNDIPAMLAGGISYQFTNALLVSVGGNYYFDKNANWEGREEEMEANNWEFQAGMQYAVNSRLYLSAGFQRTNSGVSEEYQSGMSYDLSASAIGAGARYKLNDGLALELGGLYTIYDVSTVDYQYPDPANPATLKSYETTYDKSAWLIAVGLEYSFGK